MKRGSIEISFGMIFSVIIIIALIGVAVYAIMAFLDFGGSAQMGLFYEEFESAVNDVWSSATTNRVFRFSVPSSIQSVCFGSIANNIDAGRYSQQLKALREGSSGFQQQNSNVFLYPPSKAKEFAYKRVERIDTSPLGAFDCFEARSGKVNIRLSKSEFESLVKVAHE
jgi:hypothetical protein